MDQLERTHLFLRTDGTLMLARGEVAIEAHLSAQQLLQLGVDSLRTAVALEPRLMEAACAALEQTHVLPAEVPCATRPN